MQPANPAQRGFHPVCQWFPAYPESPVYLVYQAFLACQGFLVYPEFHPVYSGFLAYPESNPESTE